MPRRKAPNTDKKLPSSKKSRKNGTAKRFLTPSLKLFVRHFTYVIGCQRFVLKENFQRYYHKKLTRLSRYFVSFSNVLFRIENVKRYFRFIRALAGSKLPFLSISNVFFFRHTLMVPLTLTILHVYTPILESVGRCLAQCKIKCKKY